MTGKIDILIVDDEADIRKLIRGILEDEGYKTRSAAGAKEAYEEISKSMPDLIVLDIWLQGSEHDGLQILAKVKNEHPDIPILMISGHGTIETAVSSIKQGAYDFIEKPFKSDRLLLMIRRALETAQLRRENADLRRRHERSWMLIGKSPLTEELRGILERVAPTNSRVLVTGEPGVGKEVAARVIHAVSPRAQKPFMVLNCATLTPERLEQELFGIGAAAGVLEQANGGTLLLDEVADMPFETQGKIVRVLQEQNFSRVGGQDRIEVDVRIIASTNRDLEAAVTQGEFRQDLFYRLNVVPVHVSALRERRDDIAGLVAHFVQEISGQSGVPAADFSDDAMAALRAYSWPGNVRQLRNTVEWALIMRGNNAQKTLSRDNLPPEITGMNGKGGDQSELTGLPLREARELFERDYLKAQIERFEGNVSKTAEFIGMERSALHRKLKSLQLLGSEDTEKKQKRA